jgi:hypothetical protein
MIMEWKDIAGTVTKSAPMLGTLLGGPVGGAIGGVISLIGSALGLSPAETTPDKVSHMLSVDPQAAVKLAEIESTHKIRIQELLLEQNRIALQERQAELADTANARSRETEVVKATGRIDINLYLLAWTIVLGFFGLTALLMYIKLPPGQTEVIFMLFGGLVAGFSTVLSYFFGSSRGSLAKSQLLASAAIVK